MPFTNNIYLLPNYERGSVSPDESVFTYFAITIVFFLQSFIVLGATIGYRTGVEQGLGKKRVNFCFGFYIGSVVKY